MRNPTVHRLNFPCALLGALLTSHALAQNEITRVTAADGATGDVFGYAVAFDGVTLISTAAFDYHSGVDAPGSAYVYSYSNGQWTQAQKLVASDPMTNDQFGLSGAIDGDALVIGAYHADLPNRVNAGAAYVFENLAGVWSQVAKLTASDAARSDEFGIVVDIAGDTVVIGSPRDDNSNVTDAGSVYVFERIAGVWAQTQKLIAPDPGMPTGFGTSVKLDRDTLLIGAALSATGPAGAAYVFRRNDGSWQFEQKLMPPDGQSGDTFGSTTALYGDTALIGASRHDTTINDAGAVYFYERENGVWQLTAEFMQPDAAAQDRFGQDVALGDGVAIVGSFQDDNINGVNAGAAFVFTRGAHGWTEWRRFSGSQVAAAALFGWALDIHGNTASVASPFEESNHGATYLFQLPGCAEDLDADGDVDIDDLSMLLSHFGESTGAVGADGDHDGDADVDIADLAEMIARLGEPC